MAVNEMIAEHSMQCLYTVYIKILYKLIFGRCSPSQRWTTIRVIFLLEGLQEEIISEFVPNGIL